MFPVAKTFILRHPQRFQYQNILFCVIRSVADGGFGEENGYGRVGRWWLRKGGQWWWVMVVELVGDILRWGKIGKECF